MKNKCKLWLSLFLALQIFTSCRQAASESQGMWVADVRTALAKETPISMKEDVTGIEYIPLETNDSCLVSNIMTLVMNDEFIFLQNGRPEKILQYTRQGKFIREIGKVGEGPGEYAPYTVEEISLDDGKREIYAHRRTLPAMVFSYEGRFLRTDTVISESMGNRYPLANGFCALSGTSLTPIQQSPWLAALQDKEGRIIATKVPFPSSVPAEVCYMKEVQFAPFLHSALAYTPCNDTLFRVAASGITPACVLRTENGADYHQKIANINEFGKDNTNNSSTLNLFTFFETPRYFYFRWLLLNDPDRCYIQRLDKNTGDLLSQPVSQGFVELSFGFSDANVMGLENDLDGGVPFAPRFVYKDRICVQAINAGTIAKLETKGYLKNKPAALQISEDDNPVIIVYTFKD